MSPFRVLLSTVSLVAALSACGSGDDSLATDAPTDTAPINDTIADSSAVDGSESSSSVSDEESPADGTGTLTLDDGTVYALAMSTCETSENGAEGFILENSYDLTGRTSDGAFLVTIGRAGLDEDFVTQIATLEGEFDENGKNAALIYRNVSDTMDLVVDGGNVSGTMMLKPIGPNRPHGDEIGAVVDVRC